MHDRCLSNERLPPGFSKVTDNLAGLIIKRKGHIISEENKLVIVNKHY